MKINGSILLVLLLGFSSFVPADEKVKVKGISYKYIASASDSASERKTAVLVKGAKKLRTFILSKNYEEGSPEHRELHKKIHFIQMAVEKGQIIEVSGRLDASEIDSIVSQIKANFSPLAHSHINYLEGYARDLELGLQKCLEAAVSQGQDGQLRRLPYQNPDWIEYDQLPSQDGGKGIKF